MRRTKTDAMMNFIPKNGELRWTVVVLYPSRITEKVDHCPFTYIAHVCAKDQHEALLIGRKEAQLSQPNEDRGAEIDWLVLVVFSGHHDIREQA